MDSNPPSEGTPRSWRETVVHEIRTRPMAWSVFALMTAAGPVAVHYLFPEAPVGVAIVGGAIFGGYCALNAVPQKFL
ncbi:MAG: hypothetical protein ACQGVC_03715 [Myxococcota bacterium]